MIKTTLTGQLLNARSFKLKVDLLSAFFLQQINRQKRESSAIDFATAQLLKGENLKSIQNELRISERSLERYFKEYIGVSPKLYERINRFQYTLRSMRKANFVKLTDFAYESKLFSLNILFLATSSKF